MGKVNFKNINRRCIQSLKKNLQSDFQNSNGWIKFLFTNNNSLLDFNLNRVLHVSWIENRGWMTVHGKICFLISNQIKRIVNTESFLVDRGAWIVDHPCQMFFKLNGVDRIS